MTYPETLAWLDGLASFEREGDWRYDTKHFSLKRMRALLEALGRPDRAYRSVIVAGTKGKGSTCAMLASILAAAGERVGLYTSPHLIEYPERIRIGMEPVAHDEFAALAGEVAPQVSVLAARGPEWQPTTFEAVTAMALLGFARRRAAIAVLEVGLGGRLDAVNAVEADAVGITSVGHDHMDQLGHTIPEIAGEKAGVIKSAAPVVAAGRTGDGALAVVEAACRKAGAPLTVTGALEGFAIALAGAHQRDNAAVALALARVILPGLPEEAVRRGLDQVRWPGRLMIIADHPRVVVYGAHTVESAMALREAVAEVWNPVRVRLILAMLKGKDHAGVARVLAPMAGRIWCPSLRHPRALPADALAAIVTAAGGNAFPVTDTAAALAAARRESGEPGDLILVTGSLALVGEAMVS